MPRTHASIARAERHAAAEAERQAEAARQAAAEQAAREAADRQALEDACERVAKAYIELQRQQALLKAAMYRHAELADLAERVARFKLPV